MEYKYLVYLGTEGYEACFDVTKIYEEMTVAKLKGVEGKDSEFMQMYNAMSMRCRFNSHRHIKKYLVIVNDIEYEEFADMVAENIYLQKMIKEQGDCLG